MHPKIPWGCCLQWVTPWLSTPEQSRTYFPAAIPAPSPASWITDSLGFAPKLGTEVLLAQLGPRGWREFGEFWWKPTCWGGWAASHCSSARSIGTYPLKIFSSLSNRHIFIYCMEMLLLENFWSALKNTLKPNSAYFASAWHKGLKRQRKKNIWNKLLGNMNSESNACAARQHINLNNYSLKSNIGYFISKRKRVEWPVLMMPRVKTGHLTQPKSIFFSSGSSQESQGIFGPAWGTDLECCISGRWV